MGGNLHRGFESLPLRSPRTASPIRPGRLRGSGGGFHRPFTGVGSGLLERERNVDNQAPDPADRIVVKSNDVYRARFRYSFRVDGFGNIKGIGNGSYRTATWHLSGTNGSHGAFDCVVSMTTTEVAVQVRGHAADGKMHVRVERVS